MKVTAMLSIECDNPVQTREQLSRLLKTVREDMGGANRFKLISSAGSCFANEAHIRVSFEVEPLPADAEKPATASPKNGRDGEPTLQGAAVEYALRHRPGSGAR